MASQASQACRAESAFHPRAPHVCEGSSREDWELLQELANGDSRAFWILWQRHQRSLHIRCLQLLSGHRADAEDAMSRACIKARDCLPVYAAEILNVRSWLNRLIRNLCIDIQRERLRRRRASERMQDSPSFCDHLVSQYPEDPEKEALRSELRSLIDRAIHSLPRRLREPCILRFYAEAPYRDIAEQMTLTSANVRKRVQQARQILRAELCEYLDCQYRTTCPSISAVQSVLVMPDGDETRDFDTLVHF